MRLIDFTIFILLMVIVAASCAQSTSTEPPPPATTQSASTKASLDADAAAELAKIYVQERKLDWGEPIQVKEVPQGFSVEFATPETERRKIGPRLLLVTTDRQVIPRPRR